jgi:hypothetical protein
MTPSIVVPGDKRDGVGRPQPDFAWQLLGWLGLALATVGFVDIALSWYPPHMGTPEWEFATVSGTLNGMPVMAMGLGLILGSALGTGTIWLARGTAIVFAVLALLIVVAALLFATNIPIALRSVQNNPVALEGLRKVIAKTAVQSALFPLIFAVLAVKGWRRAGRG